MDYEKMLKAIKDHSDLENETIKSAGYGADGGFSGFTYNGDCVDFWDKNEALILESLSLMAEEMGENNWMIMMSKFNRNDMIEMCYGYKILGAWFALEETGKWLRDKEDE